MTITVSGCGGGGGDSATSPSPQTVDNVGTISANHGHSAVITAAQLTAGNAISLSIRGSATHPHTVELTQNDLSQINASQAVTKQSSSDDDDRHSHSVTFS